MQIVSYLQKNWGKTILFIILLVIIIINFKSGYFILGNDNYTPELNPQLTFNRSIQDPAWRSYRVLGIPSDSEQADIFRSGLFTALSTFLPRWFISQVYVFFAFFMGSVSTAFLCLDIAKRHVKYKHIEILFLTAGLFYAANLVTSWMMFSPLKVFLAGYAFLPFVLWRLSRVYVKPNPLNFAFLSIAVIFFTTSGMVATTFIVESGIILFFFLYFILTSKHSVKKTILITIVGLTVIFGTQLFWILPFIQYVKTNSHALQDSFINRVLTPELIEQEVKYNKPLDVFRFYYSWLDWINNDGTFQYPYREWYNNSLVSILLGYIPTFFVVVGLFWIFIKKSWRLAVLSLLFFGGWFIIKGVNDPLGSVYIFFQNHIPLFQQVFRWQSSKVFSTLTISISLFGSLGVLYIYKKLEVLPYGKIVQLVFTICIVVSSLVYVYPYFDRGLIGKDSYVKVPEEYNELRTFLENYDPHQRIYLAPEANTLYFRSYSWGFFGSSFLNYVLPNPLIERALTTGSYENENAQAVLEQAYYSENQEKFIRALDTFNTPLVLLDKTAFKGKNGYDYDLNLMDKQLELNPHLSKIWEKNDLSLFKINDIQQTKTLVPLYEKHDWRKLYEMNILKNQPIHFYTNSKISGAIFPFALESDEIQTTPESIIISSRFTGVEDTYSLKLQSAETNTYPTRIFYNKENSTLELSPAVPRIIVQNQFVQQQVSTKNISIPNNAKFVSIGDRIIELSTISSNGYVIDVPFDSVGGNILFWLNLHQTTKLENVIKDKYTISPTKDSIMKINLTLSSLKPTQLNICAYSKLLAKCLNDDVSFYINEKDQDIHVLVPQVISSAQPTEIYLNVPQSDNIRFITIKNYTADLYSSSQVPSKVEDISNFIDNQTKTIHIEPNDDIKLVIPKIFGENSYQFQQNNQTSMDITHKTDCDRDISEGFIRKDNRGPLHFYSIDCDDQAVVKLEQTVPSQLGMLYYKGENYSGIPTIISVRESKAARKSFEDRLLLEDKTNKISYILFPPNVLTYHVELYNYGIGPRASDNNFDELAFQFLPDGWLDMELVPENYKVLNEETGDFNKLVSIDQSFHPNWQISKNSHSEPIRINGWQQGWYYENGIDENITPYFWPNDLVNVGYGILLCIGLALGSSLIYSAVKKSN